MITIHKWPLLIGDAFVVKMPRGANIVAVQEQRAEPQMWAAVDTDAPLRDRRFVVIGTGHPMPPIGVYIGTFQMHGGLFVGHLIELPALADAAP